MVEETGIEPPHDCFSNHLNYRAYSCRNSAGERVVGLYYYTVTAVDPHSC